MLPYLSLLEIEIFVRGKCYQYEVQSFRGERSNANKYEERPDFQVDDTESVINLPKTRTWPERFLNLVMWPYAHAFVCPMHDFYDALVLGSPPSLPCHHGAVIGSQQLSK